METIENKIAAQTNNPWGNKYNALLNMPTLRNGNLASEADAERYMFDLGYTAKEAGEAMDELIEAGVINTDAYWLRICK